MQTAYITKQANERYLNAINRLNLASLTSSPSQRLLSRDPEKVFSSQREQQDRGSTKRDSSSRRADELVPHRNTRQGLSPYNVQTGSLSFSQENTPGIGHSHFFPDENQQYRKRTYAQASFIVRPTGRKGSSPVYGPWPAGSVFQYGSTANRNLAHHIETGFNSAADWLRTQIYLNEKKPTRTEPADLLEHLTKEEAASGQGADFMKDKITDPRIRETHDKMRHNHDHGDGKNTEVHWLKNRKTGENAEFKFKDHPNSRGRLLGKWK